MALNPVGPLPASTYWKRRGVLLVALLVVLLVLRSCTGGGGSGPKKKVSTTPAPTPGVSRTASPRPSTAPSPKPSPAPSPTRSATPVAAGPLCADSALSLTATTDAETYALGATPKITLTVRNTSAAACRRDVGAGAVELLVYSGADRIWSSDDCSPSTAVSLVSLAPGGTQAVVKTWPGKRSKPGCSGTMAAAQAGTYKVVARVGTLRRDGAVLRLHS